MSRTDPFGNCVVQFILLCVCVCVCLVMSDSLPPHGLWPIRLLCPCDFPGNKTGVGCHYLLQGILPSQGSNLCLLHWLTDSSPLSPSFSIYSISLISLITVLMSSSSLCPLLCSHPQAALDSLSLTQFANVFLCLLEFNSLNCKEI